MNANDFTEELVVFPWNPNFATGITTIDEQHQRLVQLINKLAICSTREPTTADIDHVLKELYDYTQYHFDFEEEVWRPCLEHVPCYRKHHATHEKFLNKILELRATPIAPDSAREVLEEILQFLIDWLIFHILDSDRAMALTIQAVEQGVPLQEALERSQREVSNSKILTNTIISMYNMLTIRSLHLLNEREQIKKLSRKLEASERRERNFSDSLINNVPGLLYILDDNIQLIRWNRGFSTLLGYSDDELKNKPFSELMYQRSHEALSAELSKADQHGNTQLEVEFVRSDGARLPFVLTVHRLHTEDSAFYAGIGIDISPIMAIEAELMHNQHLYEEAQRIANLGHWSLDHRSNELTWSDQIYRIFEVDKKQFSPSYELFLNRVHPEDRDNLDHTFKSSVRSHTPYEFMHRLQMQDGRIKYIRETGKTTYNEDGTPADTIGNAQDVTKEVVAELRLEEKSHELNSALLSTVTAVAKALEARDPYTAGHEQRVAEVSVKIARQMGLDEFRIEGIRLGAIIHDLGKIAVPAELLTKPVRLSKAEFMVIQSHAEAGHDILKDIHFPWPIKEIILQHHERLDGSGYPQGLKGDAICLEAQIIAVADVFEAMSNNRPYRLALGVDKALLELTGNRDKHYNALVVDALVELVASGSL